jgi:hypothetical protein
VRRAASQKLPASTRTVGLNPALMTVEPLREALSRHRSIASADHGEP